METVIFNDNEKAQVDDIEENEVWTIKDYKIKCFSILFKFHYYASTLIIFFILINLC